MTRRKIGILGGGASGLFAAIVAAKEGADVTIMEHKDRVGKKILMTGNGKCNLTNLHINESFYYSHDLAYAMSLLKQFTPEDTIAFFHSIGLATKEKRDGGIYPVAEQAAVVLDILKDTCENLGVKILCNCHIQQIKAQKQILIKGILEIPEEKAVTHEVEKGKKKKEKKQEIIYHKKEFQEQFDSLILACGSKACPVTGSDGSGYDFVKEFGLKIYQISPALVQLHGEGDFFKALAGVRVEGKIKLEIDHKTVAEEYGEIQLTEYGISGIPVFQLSRIATQAFLAKKECVAEIDFYPYSKEALPWGNFTKKTLLGFLEGFVNKKIATVIVKEAGCQIEDSIKEVPEQKRQYIEQLLHHFIIRLTKSNPFENAQVCAGGVSLMEVQEDMSCKSAEHIYVIGELLDVDGKCGGYNLQWAWTTGYLAGKSAASK